MIQDAENHSASQRYYDAIRECIDGLEGSKLVNGLAVIDALSACLAQAIAAGDDRFVQEHMAFFIARNIHHLTAIRADGMATDHVVVQ